MGQKLKAVAKDVLPPAVYRRAKSLRRPPSKSKQATVVHGELKPAEWYDAVYESSLEYSRHYTESIYYPVWTVIADRIIRTGSRSVLDLGCGPGQFARLLLDAGLLSYRGLDFSPTSIDLARQQCPSFDFETTDISAPGVIESREYECLVSLEFLEHVEDDLAILERVKSGAMVLATVPNFPSASHVRHFLDKAEVFERYESFFVPFRIDALLLAASGSTLFLMEGTRR